MLDIGLIRESPALVRQGVEAKGEDPSRVDAVLELDGRRRQLLQKSETLKSRKNNVSEEVARRKAAGEGAEELIGQMRQVAAEIKALEEELRSVEHELTAALLEIPNIPHPTVPVGRSPDENRELRTEGEEPVVDFPLRPHWELLEKLGIVDFARGTKIAGAGFPVYVGRGAILERAMVAFFLGEAASAGYTELLPPLLINEQSATGTGQLPDKEDMMYTVERDRLFLVPTAEVPVSNFLRDEIVPERELPVKFCSYTPCFRREAGSYGKDVRGLNRVHQFDKVELVEFVHPERSYEALETMREHAERLLQRLGLRYRVLLMCSGDLGFTQAKKYDLEVWSPGQKRWLEVSSVSNFESYQARRMNVRFRPAGGGRPEIVHTLNGSALALPRTLSALLETHQTPEGKVVIPRALHPFAGFEVLG